MRPAFALSIGVASWIAVGVLAFVLAINMGERNQILMFLPILAAVLLAWGVSEIVTERTLRTTNEKGTRS